MSGRRSLLVLPLLIGALAVTGCGDERTAGDVAGGGTSASAAATPAVKQLEAAVGKDLAKAPKTIVVKGEPPKELVIRDVVTGSGTPAKDGDNVSVRYTLVAWGTDEFIDSSWGRGSEPVSFPLQSGGLIEGWIKGVPGMKPGGRRLLVVPPELGYGPEGNGPVPANATLVFVIDLVSAGG